MAPQLGTPRLCFSKSAPEIRSSLKTLVEAYEGRLTQLVTETKALNVPGTDKHKLFLATFCKLGDADGHAALASAELTLPALVSGDAEARAAASEAKKQLQHMWARAYARSDLHDVLLAAKDGATSKEEKRLVEIVLGKFKHTGAALPTEEQRAEVSKLDAQCSSIAFEIEQNINEDCTHILLSDEELAGCGDDFLKSIPLEGDKRKCSVKAPVMVPIMKRATTRETRRKMMEASQRKCMDTNSELLEKLVRLRHKAACGLGFGSHAERMLAPKMAASAQEAREFCENMLDKIAPLRDDEIAKLKARKKEHAPHTLKRKRTDEGGDDDEFSPWDLSFYSDLLKREVLTLDDERLKEFFPLRGTIDRLLDIYSQLLGLTFKKNTSLPVWHEEVVVFEVTKGSDVVGHLYLDQFPRDGKFGHQMIVPLAPSFVDSATQERCVPACVNISNLPRPQGDKPALLCFHEMQTLFHELGHAMHCLCTTTRYSILSWAWPMVPWPGGVEQDFLELPSMALEKFACEPILLSKVAQHYSGLPDAPVIDNETIQKIKLLERWMVGTGQVKYFAMALFDLILHSKEPPYAFNGQENLSIKDLFRCILEKYTGLKEIPGTHPCASWYHLVIGYDAGYYGYGWSDVYAADVFDAMLKSGAGPLAEETGRKLRDEILGPCATRPGGEMLRSFLGREPNSDAWCRMKGIAQ